MRPGGGGFGKDAKEAYARQEALDDMLLRNHEASGSNARVQRSQQLRRLAKDDGDARSNHTPVTTA
jgi:hypothetical protein